MSTDDRGEEETFISTSFNLTAHGYDWKIHDGKEGDDHLSVNCWAMDRDSKPCLIRIDNFPAFCHIELPTNVRRKYYRWTRSHVNTFMEMMNHKLGEYAPLNYDFVQRKKLNNYAEDNLFPMIRVTFSTIKGVYRCKRILESAIKTDDWGWIKCNVWEANIDCVRKLLTIKDIKHCDWFNINVKTIDITDKISTLDNEFIGNWESIVPVSSEESSNWYTYPGILSFDIESYSNNHRAMPDMYDALHPAYMISCVYQKYKQPETRKRYGIIIGPCDQVELDNCEIINVNNEYELSLAFAKVINVTDPEIITGYNILAYDYPYLNTRMERRSHEWPCMGRIINQKSVMSSKTWQSGAYGFQTINMLEMEGRISIDQLPIIKRDYKMSKYDLNSVCSKFIGKTKHDVSAAEMFRIYEHMRDSRSMLEIFKEKYPNLQPYHLDELKQDLDEKELCNNERHFKVLHAYQAAIDYYQQSLNDTNRVMAYCIQDSELVLDLFDKLNTWVSLKEMCNIVGVTIVDLITRGQQIRCLSQLYDKASRENYILDARDGETPSFSGGSVFEPIPGLYDNVICLDFCSLYPSIIMAYNICYTTFVPHDLMNKVPDEDCNVIEFSQEEEEFPKKVIADGDYNDYGTFDIDGNYEPFEADDDDDEDKYDENGKKKKKVKSMITCHYRYKFYKKKEGILPKLVKHLVEERRAVRKKIAALDKSTKVLSRWEFIRQALNIYIAGDLGDINIEENEKILKELSECVPPADPELISAAKHKLQLSELFDMEFTAKAVKKLLDEGTSSGDEFDVAISAHEISKGYQNGNPKCFVGLVKELEATKEQRIKDIASNKMMSSVLDSRQLAIKVSANSFFGFLGVQNGGLMPLPEGSASICGLGRMLIELARKYVADQYGGVQIYGDTDSIMMDLHITDPKLCDYWGNRLAQEISGIQPGGKDVDGVIHPQGRPGLFPPPLAMEFEKAMRILNLRKKKYAALLIGKDGTFKTDNILDKNGNVIGRKLVMMTKGIVLARRDNCQFLRTTYYDILDSILSLKPLSHSAEIMVKAVNKLIDAKVDFKDLIIVRGLGGNYKSDTYFMKVFADRLRNDNKIVKPGDRLDYIVANIDNETKIGRKMRLVVEYEENLVAGTPYQIDYRYYLEKVLKNPINQLISVGYKKLISQLTQNNFGFKPSKRHKVRTMEKPIDMLIYMWMNSMNLSEFNVALNKNIEYIEHPPSPKKCKFNVVG